jgi:hypothetical protein
MSRQEAETLEATKTISIEIDELLYEKVIEKNIDVKKIVNDALVRAVKSTFSEEELKKGYEEMSEINLGLAKMCLEAENEALEKGELYLTECE